MLESLLSTQPFEYQRLSKEEMEKRGILGRLVGVIADYTNPTRNGRKYGEKLWDAVFENPIMKERIENRCCLGELGHPTDREETDMSKVAVCLSEQPIKKDGKLYGVFDIINSPNGQILKSLCDYGCTIGVSSRGSGDVITDYDGNESVDPSTYNCEGWDCVLIPAVKEARLQYVTESLDKKRYNKSLRDKLVENISKETEENQRIMTESLSSLGICLDEQSQQSQNKSLLESMYRGYLIQNTSSETLVRDETGKIVVKVSTDDEAREWIDTKLSLEEELDGLGYDNVEDTEDTDNNIEIPITDKFNDRVIIRVPDDLGEFPFNKQDEDNNEVNNIAVDDDKALVEELQEALNLNRKLDGQIVSLKERLSVSYAKENELLEEINNLKDRVNILSKVASNVKQLNAKINTLEESLKQKEAENEKSKVQFKESLDKRLESNNRLSESVEKKDLKIKMLSEKLDNSSNENKRLSEDCDKMAEQISTYQKDFKQLKEQYSKKVTKQNALIEKYQKIALNSINKYIDSQATRLGVKSEEIKNRLPESYGFKDIDKVCEDLQEYKLNVNLLPFNTNSVLNENIKLSAKNVKNDFVINPDDDVTDYDLRIAGLI